MSWGESLEAYTRKRPNEVLVVRVLVEGSPEEALVFRGATSYLTRATPTDPSETVIPPDAQLLGVDRQKAPFSPVNPQLIAGDLDREGLERLLAEVGLSL